MSYYRKASTIQEADRLGGMIYRLIANPGCGPAPSARVPGRRWPVASCLPEDPVGDSPDSETAPNRVSSAINGWLARRVADENPSLITMTE
jgi:hypothetical protein